jgi:hypothetical protein
MMRDERMPAFNVLETRGFREEDPYADRKLIVSS